MVPIFFRKVQNDLCQMRLGYLDIALERQLFDTYQQAIVELGGKDDSTQSPHGVELLNRPLKSKNFENTEQFYSFFAAHGKSMLVDVFTAELGLLRWQKSLTNADPTHDKKKLFVNVHLSTLFSPEWEQLLSKLSTDPSQIVLEVSEREGLNTYSKIEVYQMITRLKTMGFQVAVDDLGMGYSGLYTLSVVQPDYVKIDRQLVYKVDEDAYRQHMMHALMEYWLKEKVNVIVEGVERQEEVNFFQQCGAQYAQGYWFHRPEPVQY